MYVWRVGCVGYSKWICIWDGVGLIICVHLIHEFLYVFFRPPILRLSAVGFARRLPHNVRLPIKNRMIKIIQIIDGGFNIFPLELFTARTEPGRSLHENFNCQKLVTLSGGNNYIWWELRVRQPIRGQRLQRSLRGHRVATGKPPLDTSITCRRLA